MRGAAKVVAMLWLCAAFAHVHASGSAAAVRKQAEGSMLVTGHVVIAPDGTVAEWSIDGRDSLPPAVAGLIDASAVTWRFEPEVVDGVPRTATAPMSLRVVAQPIENGQQFQIAIASGHFGDDALAPGTSSAPDRIRSLTMRPPSYPDSAAQVRARGTVYVVMQIDRDGKVSDAFAEQVNLKVVASPRQMSQLRDVFARSALRAARTWTFLPPTTGQAADELHWFVRVPVEYFLDGQKDVAYGQWDIYVPGPRQNAPWRALEDLEGFQIPSDSLIAGEIYQVGTGRKLLTPLQGG